MGRYDQGTFFASGNYLNVNRTKGWDSLSKGESVDFWVKKTSGSGTVRLFSLQGGVDVYLSNGDTLTAAVQDTAGVRVQLNGPGLGTNWAHVAFTFNPTTRQMALYLNGKNVASRLADGFGTLKTSGLVRVGPESSTAQLILDEVKVSNVERRADEVAYNANRS